MSTAKNIQAKVFGSQDSVAQAATVPPPNSTSSGEQPVLSIQIPKPPPLKLPGKKQSQSTESPPTTQKQKEVNGASGVVRKDSTLRERLLKKLGTRYDGVERYRLEEDEQREKHWKRWGPYLSERQWVRSCSLFHPFCCPISPSHHIGYCS